MVGRCEWITRVGSVSAQHKYGEYKERQEARGRQRWVLVRYLWMVGQYRGERGNDSGVVLC